jgi:hypothetical protein
MILAPGVVTRTLLTGRTTSVLGAIPNEHCRVAPEQTCMGIKHLSRESLGQVWGGGLDGSGKPADLVMHVFGFPIQPDYQ